MVLVESAGLECEEELRCLGSVAAWAGGGDDRGVWRRFGEFVGGRRVGRPRPLLVWPVREPELEEAGFGWVAEGESEGRESSSSEVNS